MNQMKWFFFLVFSTALTISLYALGYLDTKKILYPNDKNETFHFFSLGKVKGSLQTEEGQAVVRCQLELVETFSLCGVSLELGKKDRLNGLDLSIYNRVDFEIEYISPVENDKLKVSFRNHNENYSIPNDFVSQKFNSVSFNPSNFNKNFITVPLKSLNVDRWWLEKYSVNFENSMVDLTNIVRIEFSTNKMPVLGEYSIAIRKLVFRGERISEYNLLKAIVILWLGVALLLLAKQHHKLKELSKIDSLTGIYNHRGIREKIKEVSAESRIYLFYMALDQLKEINGTYGHKVGNQVLIEFTDVIKNIMMKFGEKGHFCRFSGNEFIIVFENISEKKMSFIASSICGGQYHSITLPSQNLSVGISLGVAKGENVAAEFDKLISHSSSAMYHVKSNSLPHFQVFDKHFSQHVYFNKEVAGFIKDALRKNEFYLQYMPIHEAQSLKVVALEVLLRTTSKKMEGIGPDVFIPIAEKFNLIKEIDAWVIENTFSIIKENYTYLEATKPIFCINISSEQLRNTNFVGLLSRLLKQYDIPAEWIELELTETSLVNVEDKNIEVLQGIRELGVRLSLDDYGTGYISFNQLINYPVNNLKIDKSFIDLLEKKDDASKMIVKSIHSLATTYQLTTVAEGVETIEQYRYLSELGCDFLQGYLFCKPVPWDQVKTLLDPSHTEKLRESLREKSL
ncbi:bifunctional diguanylate cyclase/phosphodiesterase [Marinomonas sp. C2222]|uniref:Bifunctional diguanylate cyclase/phosphodiesterase n=1 Tax=Marinomonas sargassi TaxID=2984494 RepID=A0ABT2YSS6_9GAMM|nr:bifunctional diguanylate cyclase/phosphodiesterase [Marinomonas sargassi]MCV2402949.1 bifunctional diguanylate cyclase/phosphodiesterase [Marinomonas sargassi]